MTGEPAPTEKRMAPGLLFSSECAHKLTITEIAKWPLCFIFSYVLPVTNEEKDLCNQSSHNGKLG